MSLITDLKKFNNNYQLLEGNENDKTPFSSSTMARQ